ncbi:hypothetical protein KUTeg_023174 [Tegillarca granosa]|uniref:Uncharacterized protein n=1 Tax=Tegillarca granosa TaxID=220873 RepID=A0ABQ9E4G7_TEGGR|nr:hypothetical protein KUTeg_023174 [Tegillarca granosa]
MNLDTDKSTLADRVSGKVEGAFWGKKSVIDKKDEFDLTECAKKIFGKHKGIGFKNGQPSEMWWCKFRVRNPWFSLRAAEATASVRHDAMSRPRVSLNPKHVRVIAKTGQKTVQSKCSNSGETITVIGCGNAAGRVIPPDFIVPVFIQ